MQLDAIIIGLFLALLVALPLISYFCNRRVAPERPNQPIAVWREWYK
jgi:hypothetical protein